jgi:hypothetical protein
MNNSILRVKRDGVEYYTLVATGESGMSQRGLARACGVTNPAILKLEKQLITKSPSKWLQSFVGKDLKLITEIVRTGKRGAGAIVYNASFCSAVIKHYAYSGSEQAQEIDQLTGVIGLTSYIHGVTGWLPEQYQASQIARSAIDRIRTLFTRR